MKNSNIIIGFGVLVLLLPFLGLPQTWDNILYFISGLTIVGLSVYNKLEVRTSVPKRNTSTFEENGIYETEKEPINDREI